MAVSLKKGEKISLKKEAPNLKKIMVGLGWSERQTDGPAFDLDASAFMLAANDKVRDDKDFIYFNNKGDASIGIIHMGDNRTGAGDGDDETIVIELDKINPAIQKIVFTVSMYHDPEKGGTPQTFGLVSKAYIRLLNPDDLVTSPTGQQEGKELTRFDLGEDADTFSSVKFAELYRHEGEWRFRALGEGYSAGFQKLVEEYGLQIG